MSLKTNLVLVGDGEFAEIAYEYFTHDSNYAVKAFAVEEAFRKNDERLGLPVVNFEQLEKLYPPESHHIFVAITNTQLNRVRTRLYKEAKKKGYKFANYISSRAFVWHNVEIGENCFVFENNVIQHNCKIGNNVILWSGNHVGHRSEISDNCFISSHVTISGFCKIGFNCFLGVNSTICDNISIGDDCIIGAGAVIANDTKAQQVYKGERAKASKVDSLTLLKIR